MHMHLAQTLNYDVENQTRVGVAALLHEIGVAWIPQGVLYETGQLNPHAQQRPVYSSKLLQEFYPEDAWLAETAGQVYERADGNGFPLEQQVLRLILQINESKRQSKRTVELPD